MVHLGAGGLVAGFETVGDGEEGFDAADDFVGRLDHEILGRQSSTLAE